MRRMKSKWFAILAVLFALGGAVTVMASCDKSDHNNESEPR